MTDPHPHPHQLAPFKYTAFPLGSIEATGWLHDQLTVSANALPGQLFSFYRYVADSTWLGGSYEYSELNEAAPYWFNYIVPLAWTLDDSRLKAQAKTFLDYVLDHQADDGWLGPETTRQTRGVWARSLLFFGLIVCSLLRAPYYLLELAEIVNVDPRSSNTPKRTTWKLIAS
jgi:hypothetical protein